MMRLVREVVPDELAKTSRVSNAAGCVGDHYISALVHGDICKVVGHLVARSADVHDLVVEET
jgi:hypothetical protein